MTSTTMSLTTAGFWIASGIRFLRAATWPRHSTTATVALWPRFLSRTVGATLPGARLFCQIGHFVAEDRRRDLARMGLASHQRFRQVQGLFRRGGGGHGWLERIDNGLDERGAARGKSRLHHRTHFFRLLHPKTDSPTRLRKFDEVDRLEFDAVLGIPQEDHLLPFDLSKHVVL